MREILEIFLKKEGYDVQTGQSAPEGLDLMRSTEFDLIVSDIRMPDMTGIDFLRSVRANNFNGQFILLTADASADSAIQALKMGAFDYILKTASPQQVVDRVAAALRTVQ